jgi:glycosyltransferase involved in cell wall biosynthesis
MIAPEFLPMWGGVGTYIVELVRHLPIDIEVHVVTPMREALGEDKVSTADYDFRRYFGNNVHVHFVCKATDTFFYNANFQLACARYVPKLVKKEGIDIIHIGHHMASLLLGLKKLNVPIVTTVHNTVKLQREGTKMSGVRFEDLAFNEKATFLMYPLLRLIEISYFSGLRYYITVSEWMKQQLLEQHPQIKSTISVVYNSVDTKQFSPGFGSTARRKDLVLFTGRIIAAKGVRYLVEAIPMVLKEYPDAFFTFIGSGNSRPYRRYLKDIGVSEENFAFLGYLRERSELVEYYRACSVYAAPSTLWENLPIRVLEAMACGSPTVASSVCAIPEVIDNGVNGVLIPPGSVEKLAEALCILLGDSNLRMKIGDKARKTVLEKFDSRVNANRTVQVYRQILSKLD